MSRILIFANGDLPNLEKARALIKPDDILIAADGGARHALALGLTPNIIIGDLDSLPANFEPSTFNGEIIQHPRDKNESDLELAIQHALSLNPAEIIIIAALGGRMDQTLANIALLSGLQLAACNAQLNDGVEEIFFCWDQVQVKGRSGDLVSLIPWQGKVTGIVTKHLKWRLQNETLFPEKSRGISNEMMNDAAMIQIKSGLLLIIHRRRNN